MCIVSFSFILRGHTAQTLHKSTGLTLFERRINNFDSLNDVNLMRTMHGAQQQTGEKLKSI